MKKKIIPLVILIATFITMSIVNNIFANVFIGCIGFFLALLAASYLYDKAEKTK